MKFNIFYYKNVFIKLREQRVAFLQFPLIFKKKSVLTYMTFIYKNYKVQHLFQYASTQVLSQRRVT